MTRYYGLFLRNEGNLVGIARENDDLEIEKLNVITDMWELFPNLEKYLRVNKIYKMVIKDHVAERAIRSLKEKR
jgi:hypothetical protein